MYGFNLDVEVKRTHRRRSGRTPQRRTEMEGKKLIWPSRGREEVGWKVGNNSTVAITPLHLPGLQEEADVSADAQRPDGCM